jgi:hypothetical protein
VGRGGGDADDGEVEDAGAGDGELAGQQGELALDVAVDVDLEVRVVDVLAPELREVELPQEDLLPVVELPALGVLPQLVQIYLPQLRDLLVLHVLLLPLAVGGDEGDLVQDEEAVQQTPDFAVDGAVALREQYLGGFLAELLQFLVLDDVSEGLEDGEVLFLAGGEGLEGLDHLVEDVHEVDDFALPRELILLAFLRLPPLDVSQRLVRQLLHESVQILDEAVQIGVLDTQSHDYLGNHVKTFLDVVALQQVPQELHCVRSESDQTVRFARVELGLRLLHDFVDAAEEEVRGDVGEDLHHEAQQLRIFRHAGLFQQKD